MAINVEQRPLKVTIIGAGIAGLTAALALRKQGHEVTVRGMNSSRRNHR
jgi:salicylate hydroxylase